MNNKNTRQQQQLQQSSNTHTHTDANSTVDNPSLRTTFPKKKKNLKNFYHKKKKTKFILSDKKRKKKTRTYANVYYVPYPYACIFTILYYIIIDIHTCIPTIYETREYPAREKEGYICYFRIIRDIQTKQFF